ncbi:hypothetical protein NPIL_216781 [Nephila pilipes]|uniref:Uncharacterized protein n=1 Tax=Nephila pilipes TaxID=299642 RepID=A0A8X6P280_NEPPI|nr:hypothetical protein NPIL_216781 [Nephila pilipes]
MPTKSCVYILTNEVNGLGNSFRDGTQALKRPPRPWLRRGKPAAAHTALAQPALPYTAACWQQVAVSLAASCTLCQTASPLHHQHFAAKYERTPPAPYRFCRLLFRQRRKPQPAAAAQARFQRKTPARFCRHGKF